MDILNNGVAIFSGILLLITVCTIINYIITSLALYNVAKAEGDDKPWLAWIPIGNAYMTIKLGKGNMLFIIPFVLAMIFTGMIRNISIVIYTVYSIYMYKNICDRYNASFLPILIGSLSLIVGIVPALINANILIYLIGLYGQWNLYRCVTKKVKVQ
ncbi:hypothetical protein QJR26_12830 [Clostridium baratii]